MLKLDHKTGEVPNPVLLRPICTFPEAIPDEMKDDVIILV